MTACKCREAERADQQRQPKLRATQADQTAERTDGRSRRRRLRPGCAAPLPDACVQDWSCGYRAQAVARKTPSAMRRSRTVPRRGVAGGGFSWSATA